MSRDRNGHDPETLKYMSILQAETGYPTFERYLESHGSIYPKSVREAMSLQREEESVLNRRLGLEGCVEVTGQCLVTDISVKRDSAQKLDIRRDIICEKFSTPVLSSASKAQVNRQTTAIEIIEALKLPVNEDSVRLVLWHMPNCRLEMEWVDVFFLLLRIPPSFFRSLVWKRQQGFRHHEGFYHRPQHLYDLETWMIGNFLTISLDNPVFTEGPVILIVLMGNLYRAVEWLESNTCRSNSLLREEDESSFIDENTPWEHHKAYVRLLERVLERGPSSDHTFVSLYCTTMYSILRIHVITLQESYQSVWAIMIRLGTSNESFNELALKRAELRRNLEDFENCLQCFQSYIRIQGQHATLNTLQYLKYEEHWNRVVAMSRRLEAEVRDQMQLATGMLSIDESRRSIELSNIQIREGKQGLLSYPRCIYCYID